MSSYAILAFFLFLGAALAWGALLTGHLLSPRTPRTPFQREAYECGNSTIGPTRVRFRVGYLFFALLFLVFDIETLLLFPAVSALSAAFRGEETGISPLLAAGEVLLFVAVLSFGLVWAWRKGALKWD